MDAATLAALLAALVPVALFWALIHKRRRAAERGAAGRTGPRPTRPASQGRAQEPVKEVDLAADPQTPAATSAEQATANGADSAAAAAGGALILGYELSQRARDGDEKGSEH